MSADRSSAPTAGTLSLLTGTRAAQRASTHSAALFALDVDWRFVAFNRAAEVIFDLRREDVLGKLLWEVSPTIVGTEFE